MSANTRDYYAEEVEFLTANGASLHEIITSLNLKPSVLARALYRAGRPDLARPFGALDKRQRKSA